RGVSGLLNAADHGLANAERDVAALPDTASEDRVRALEDKLTALRAYAWMLEERLSALMDPIPAETFVKEQPVTFSPTPLSAPTSSSARPLTPAFVERISLSANPNPATTSQIVHLLVTGTRADGSSVDLTAQSTFEKFGGLGTLNGPTYASDIAGSVTVRAQSIDHGQTLTSSITIEVKAAPRTLKSIDLVALGPTTIAPGDSVGFRIVANYSDGRTQDVSTASTFILSVPALGNMSGSTFQSAQQTPPAAIETVTARYSELGVTVTSFVDVTIR
ncbi:MAG: hypothetical protein AAB879_02755, partial [Patescibacteria group bacterium]